NPFEPVIVTRLHESITQLANAATVLTEECVRGITTSPERLRHRVHHSVGLATALTPLIGYSAATRLAQEALMNWESAVDLVLRDELDTAEESDATREPERLVHPHEVGTTSPSTGASPQGTSPPHGWPQSTPRLPATQRPLYALCPVCPE